MLLLKTEVRRIIKKELGSFLKKYGYKFDAKAEGFLRYFNGGFNQIGVAIFDYRPKFQISPYFLIRLDKVEDIVQKHIFVLEKYRDMAYTINTGIEYFADVKEYELRTEEELHEILKRIEDLYISKIDTFLKYFSDIENLDRSLNDEKLRIGKLIEPDNCIRSMIIAKLNNNPNFERIAEMYYKNYVEEYNLDVEDGPNRIRETINYLNTR